MPFFTFFPCAKIPPLTALGVFTGVSIYPPPFVLRLKTNRFNQKGTFLYNKCMAQVKKLKTPRDPRKVHPKLRSALRARIWATQNDCGVCGYPVDKTLTKGLPLSPELDEIIPVSRGGSPYDFENLQLTHRKCNRKKGNRLVGETGGVYEDPLPVSRAW